MNKSIIADCEFIVSHELSWKEAKEVFKLDEGNIQKIYIRYIITLFGVDAVEYMIEKDG